MFRPNPYPGILIAVEGLDAAGKRTQSIRMKQFLEMNGKRVVLTEEPNPETEIGRRIIETLRDKSVTDPCRMQAFFAEGRAMQVRDIIIPGLSDPDTIVVTDRFILSSLAYGLPYCPLDYLVGLNAGFFWPNLTLVLEVRPEVSVRRLKKRGREEEMFDKLEVLKKVKVAYDSLLKMPDVYPIDGEMTVYEVSRAIQLVLTEREVI